SCSCWYCVNSATLVNLERRQLDSVKSTIRKIPPNAITGFGRFSVNGNRCLPSPPARINACIRDRSGVDLVFMQTSVSDSIFGYGLARPLIQRQLPGQSQDQIRGQTAKSPNYDTKTRRGDLTNVQFRIPNCYPRAPPQNYEGFSDTN